LRAAPRCARGAGETGFALEAADADARTGAGAGAGAAGWGAEDTACRVCCTTAVACASTG
jgi:hypothetical protein